MVQVFGQEPLEDSGGRVSTTWVIYLQVGYSFPKGEIIPDVVIRRMPETLKVGTARPAA